MFKTRTFLSLYINSLNRIYVVKKKDLHLFVLLTRLSWSRWWCGCSSAACWSSCTPMSAWWCHPVRTSPAQGTKTLQSVLEAAVWAPPVLSALVPRVSSHSATLLLDFQPFEFDSKRAFLLPVFSQQWWHDPHQPQHGQFQCRAATWRRLSAQQEDHGDTARQFVRARETGYSQHPCCPESRRPEDVCQVISSLTENMLHILSK